ncbi:MAG: hypothetical protein HN353_11325 [Bdellovibrionales bacterium]|jgi:hypothetical protein|nr:hypothetical protein [Bdellovibrionales bacterium]MBT3525139.1 hypothetical protein [Bdellovibrionales bacterium]MBT7668858.1 hypothetical protein [Bdellovibrionales bacterium]MBT7766747.1 hypothetical protein [Bdellovibrionales bacterium]
MSLVSICLISFVAVFICLGVLALLMTVMVHLFPASTPDTNSKQLNQVASESGDHLDSEVVVAIHNVYRQLYPEAKIVSISEE